MQEALHAARCALQTMDVPVGAVVVIDNEIVGPGTINVRPQPIRRPMRRLWHYETLPKIWERGGLRQQLCTSRLNRVLCVLEPPF
jgi:hypothetical protein